jgi:hypothetical protein
MPPRLLLLAKVADTLPDMDIAIFIATAPQYS